MKRGCIVVALLVAGFLLAACQTPRPAPTPTETALPSPSQPTETPVPPSSSPTSSPSPTPAASPTPTLPAGPEFACIPPDAPRQVAKVLQVVDGDTIRVFMNRQVFTVRYLGIDTPETKKGTKPAHPWGPAATRRNRELVGGKTVLLVADPYADDIDRYGRLLRYVLAGNVFVEKVLVKEGLAWVYPAYNSCQDDLLTLEREAKLARRGVWSRATPTPIK